MADEHKHPGGRPLRFTSPEDLQERIDLYFAERMNEEGKFTRPVSITGLALALDTSRETLMNYERRDEFFDTIKRAKLRIENFYEEHLLVGRATGPIFALKNFGWKDQTTVNVNNTTPTADEDQALLDQYAKDK